VGCAEAEQVGRKVGDSAMISAREFQNMISIWDNLTPFIEGYTYQVVRAGRYYTDQVTSSAVITPSDSALIAELGFEFAAAQISKPSAADSEVINKVYLSLQGLPGFKAARPDMNAELLNEAHSIGNNLVTYLKKSKRVSYIFHPIVPGCGVVDETRADIIGNGEIIEVKAVRRTFQSMDLRQLLTYACMSVASGNEVDTLTLLNPRLGTKFSSSLSDVCYNISGSNSVDLMYNIQRAMQDIQVSV
jgi:DNA-directed RNA polymerase subunit L